MTKVRKLRIAFLLSILLYSLLSSTFSYATSKGLTRLESLELFSEQENYAVVVGINTYDYIPTLGYAVNDAQDIARYFEQQGYTVDLLTDYAATPNRIIAAVERAAQLATNDGSSERGNLVFTFSGHGFRDNHSNYLATSDTDPNNLVDTALAMDTLASVLQESGVKQRIMFIDACRNDPSKSVQHENAVFSLDDDAEGLAILYSTRAESLSWEDPKLEQGVFTHFLLRGLQGKASGVDGLVTFDRLHRYVRSEVKKYVNKRFRKVQIPYIGGERSGEFVVGKVAAGSSPDVVNVTASKQDSARNESSNPMERKIWGAVKLENTISAYIRYMQMFPFGFYIDEARSRAQDPTLEAGNANFSGSQSSESTSVMQGVPVLEAENPFDKKRQ